MSQTDLSEIDTTGRCDCGAVSVHAKGRVVSMFQCACINCQTLTGSGHSSIVLLRAPDVEVTGKTQAYERDAASGAKFRRYFCPACGTTVHAQSSRAEGITIVPVGVFAGNNDWYAPKHLIFAERHPEWDQLPKDLPQHSAYPERAKA